MKKIFIIPVVILLALSLLITACSTGNINRPTVQAAAQQTTAPATTSQYTTSAPAVTTSTPANTTSAPSNVTPTGTLRIATQDFSYESFDPIFYESFWGWAMYDPLISWDDQGNFIPSVAESWTMSPDGKTWTFKIRKDIKFSNGDPLTAADVAFSVERFSSKDSTNPWSPYLRNNFASISTPDDYTFVYQSNTPEPALQIPFAWTRILPKKYFESVGQDGFRAAPIGSGPWKLVKFVSKTSCEFEAVPNHWRITPAFSRVIEYMVPEESTRIAMLKRGDVDITWALTNDRLVELQKAGYRLQEIGDQTLGNINFQGTWLTTGPTKEKAFRQAMSYAINRQELSDTFYQGLAKPGGRWYMDERTWGWDPSLGPDPYDPAKAKELLTSIGYPNNFTNPVVTINAQAGPQADMVQALQGYWDALGIQTKIQIVDAMTFGGLFFVRNDKADGTNVGDIIPWVYAGFFNSVYHCANMYKSTGVHSTGNDPQADVLYEKAVSELDPVKAKQYWTEFQQYAKEMYVDVGIYTQPSYVVVGPNVGIFTDKVRVSLWDAWAGIQHSQ